MELVGLGRKETISYWYSEQQKQLRNRKVIDTSQVNPDQTVVDDIGEIYVSYKAQKNTVPPARYKMLFSKFEFVRSKEKGTPGVNIQLSFDPVTHEDYKNRVVYESFWFAPGAMYLLQTFLVALKINPELLREVPTGNTLPDGSPEVRCEHTIREQIQSVYGGSVYCDLIETDYEGVAADGVSKEKRYKNEVAQRGYSRV